MFTTDSQFSYIEVLRGKCNLIWLVAKVLHKNNFFFYKIDQNEIYEAQEISFDDVGAFNTEFYGGMVASQNGIGLPYDDVMGSLNVI